MSLQLTIPDSVLQNIHLPGQQIEQELLKELAIALYSKALINYDAALDLSQLECTEFGRLVGEKDINRRCGRFDMNGELAYRCSE